MPHWREMRNNGRTRLVVDLDDDYFHIDPSNQTAWDYWMKGKDRDGSILRDGGLLPLLRESIEMSDAVTVCSQALGESIERTTKHPNVRVVENSLPAALDGDNKDANGRPRTRDYDPELLTIGWAGTENTAAWLPLILDAVNKAARDDYGRRVFVKFIGVHASQAAAMGFKFRRTFGECVHFIPDPRQYLHELSRIDVLLAPYRSTPFTEAKFPTKALETGALGIPLIASAIRPYSEWITHGVNGFLVPTNRPHEWGRYLGALINDAGLRRKIGLAARVRASRNTLQNYGEKWESACLD
jgi:hypothetical protein